MQQEPVLYQDLTIKITTSEALFADTTYSIATISRVTSGVLFKSLPLVAFPGLISIICVWVFVSTGSLVAEILSVATIPVMVLLIVPDVRPYRVVSITTTSGSVFVVLKSKDASYVQGVVKALNRAIAQRI